MCTAISYRSGDHYFGRNLDLEYSYDEAVVITPRKYPLTFRLTQPLDTHYAMIGMATVVNEYPLYYDGTNEHGLSMAGLNFPGNAFYFPATDEKDNISPFEFIPWILAQCKTVMDARRRLDRLNLTDIPFSKELPLSPLHWIIADKNESVVVESTKDGMKVYHNPVGVLTNNPPFDYHMYHLCNYLNLTVQEPENRFSASLKLTPYSRGMGAIGLPGDLSSASRFVRAVFTKLNSVSDETESGALSQFFHILDSVSMVNGCVRLGSDYEKTVYSSCCNTDNCRYYYTTYDNRQITGVDLFRSDLDGSNLARFPLRLHQQLRMEN